MSAEGYGGGESMGGGGSAGLTLAQVYAAGLSTSDSTLALDATRGGVVLNATGFTGSVINVLASAVSKFSVSEAGNVRAAGTVRLDGLGATGLVLNTNGGNLSIAVPGTDYVLPGGVVGGQTISGGTAAADSLSLRASSAGSPTGKIRIGNTGGTAILTILEGAGNTLIGVNNEAPAAEIDIRGGSNASVNIQAINGGAGSNTQLQLLNSGGTTGVVLNIRSTAGTITGIANAGSGISHFGTIGPLVVGTVGAADVVFPTNSVERMRIDANGNVSIGIAALATNATNGFPYAPTCAGTPTGSATAKTGLAPFVYDITNHKLWFNEGTTTWKGVVLA